MSVLAAVEADLALLAKRMPGIESTARAAMARALAVELDAGNSATSKSMCAKELGDIMDALEERAPEVKAGDAVDDLASRRAVRRGGAAA